MSYRNDEYKNLSFFRKKQKNNVKKIIWLVLFLFFFIGFAVSFFHTVFWTNDNHKIKALEKNLQKIKIHEITPFSEEDANTILVNEPESKTDIYWKYIHVSPIDVDIHELQKENPDTVGWIQVLGTNINYPVVQASDNDYYLNHDFLKQKNNGGWVFLDYRNDFNSLGRNTIVYGHRRYNQSIFGTLKNVLTDSWLNQTDNHVIKVSTINYNYLFQIFSVYSVANETYYLKTTFSDDNNYLKFLDTITKRSIHDFHTEVNEKTKILTLSTCHNEHDRLVVHAKLIQINEKN